MKMTRLLAIALLLLGGGFGNAAMVWASGSNLPGNTLRVQRVEIMDQTGFERPMVAATAMIPFGWRAEGGIVWKVGACVARTTNWKATSPDGNRGIALLPSEVWHWSNFPSGDSNCPRAQISSIKQYLENLVQRARPGSRIIDFRNREDLAKPYQGLNKVMPMANGELRTWVEADEILIGYTNQNGVDIRETASAVAMFTMLRSADINGAVMETLTGQAMNGFAVHAPSGQLNFRTDEMLRNAIQPAPEWSARISNADARDAANTTQTYANISAINKLSGQV